MNIFKVVANNNKCKELLGESPTRFYPHGIEHDETPYAVYQVVAGSPENNLSHRPDCDSHVIQVDAYAKTYQQTLEIGVAIRDAIELNCHITSWRGIYRESETKLFRLSFDCRWWSNR